MRLPTWPSGGFLISRAGSGIFVAEVLGSAFSPALTQLFSTHDEAVFDYISFRRDMEGLAAERAAVFGSETDLKLIDTIFGKMELAHQKRDPSDEAQLDAEFHMAIIEASHNVIMLHMLRSMFELLRQGVFYNRQVMFKNRMTRDQLSGPAPGDQCGDPGARSCRRARGDWRAHGLCGDGVPRPDAGREARIHRPAAAGAGSQSLALQRQVEFGDQLLGGNIHLRLLR